MKFKGIMRAAIKMADQATCYFLTVSVLVLTKFIHSLLDLAFPNLESEERDGGGYGVGVIQ